MFKHSGWLVLVLVLVKQKGSPDAGPIVVGPVSKRTAKRAAQKMKKLALVCQSASAISIRAHLGGWNERKR